MVAKIATGEIKEDVIVRVKNGYVKNNNGFNEVNVGTQGEIEINPEGVEITNVKEYTAPTAEKKQIHDLKAGDFASIIGTITQAFEPRFYDCCNQCGRKVVLEEGSIKCKEHGAVEKKDAAVFNFLFDDGSGNIRCVAFRDQAEKILGMTSTEVKEANFENLKSELLGKQVMLSGKVNKNDMFDRLEFVANSVEDIDPKQIAQEMVNTI